MRLLYAERARRVLPALALILGLTAFAPHVVLAHGRLKSSTPAAGAHLGAVPRELRLDFSESPELTFTMVRLVGPDGRAISLGPLGYAADSRRSILTAVGSPMIAGVYTVTWQMAGDDGHPVRGEYDFVVAPGAAGIGASPAAIDARASSGAQQNAAMRDSMHHDPASMPEGNGFGSDSPVYVVIRWLQFIGLLLAIGVVSFRFFVLGALRRTVTGTSSGVTPMIVVAERRAADLGRMATGLLAITLLLRLGAQSYAMHGAADAFDLRLVAQMVQRTKWGWGWMVQLVGIALLGAGFLRARRTSVLETSHPQEMNERAFWWRVAAMGAALAAVSPALAGHAASAPRLRALAIAADWVHVIAASSWLGTLAVLLVAGLTTSRQRVNGVSGQFVRSLVNAFSPVALVSAGLAAVTGVFAAWIHVGTIPNLSGTQYGITLLVKLGILAVAVMTGFYNWRFVQPELGTVAATARLKRSATVEVTVALLVLLVTAILVASPTSMDMVM